MFFEALHYHLDNIFIRICLILHRQIIGIPMGTNCTPLVADLFLFCYERDFIRIAYNAQMLLISAHADISILARGLKFGLSLHLQPLFVYVSGVEGSTEYAHMHTGPSPLPNVIRTVIACTGQLHD